MQLRAPARLDALTPAWVAAALAEKGYGGVEHAEVLEVLHGTATKVRLKLTRGPGSAAPETLWAKAGWENHSKAREQVYAGEVYFYNELGPALSDIAPKCFYADRDPATGAAIVLLEDLLPRGATFNDIIQPLTPEAMQAGLDMIATFHARFWMKAALAADPFLSSGGAYMASNVLGRKFTKETIDRLSALPRFKEMPHALRDMGRMRDAFYAVQRHWADEPRCLNHGDAHVGQSCRYPDGRFGLLDWQCAKFSNWAQDVAYFLVSGLSVEDRRAHEDDLLAHYLTALAARGATPPPFAEARETLRLHAIHGMGWCLTAPELQPEENCAVLTVRFAAAMMDYRTIDRALAAS